MHRLYALALLTALVPVAARAADAETQAVIDKAVREAGGAEKLAKLKAATFTAKGVITFPGAEVATTREDSLRLPGRWRRALKFDSEAVKGEMFITVAPDVGWRRFGGPAEELSAPELAVLREEAHAFWLATLLPLSDKDAGLTVAMLPETRADSAPAFGLKVSKAGQPDVSMYFDKKSGLLVKLAYKGRDVGKPVPKEYTFSDHKDFDGLKLPTKQADFMDGKKNGSWQDISYRFPEKIDDATFGRP